MHNTYKKTRVGSSDHWHRPSNARLIALRIKCRPFAAAQEEPCDVSLPLSLSLSSISLGVCAPAILLSFPHWDTPSSFKEDSFLSYGLCCWWPLGLDCAIPRSSHGPVQPEISFISTSSLQPSRPARLHSPAFPWHQDPLPPHLSAICLQHLE